MITKEEYDQYAIDGFNAIPLINMNFGCFGHYTSSMKKHYRYFFKPPSGQALGSPCLEITCK